MEYSTCVFVCWNVYKPCMLGLMHQCPIVTINTNNMPGAPKETSTKPKIKVGLTFSPIFCDKYRQFQATIQRHKYRLFIVSLKFIFALLILRNQDTGVTDVCASPPPIFWKFYYQKSGFTIVVVLPKNSKNAIKLNIAIKTRSRPLNFNFSNH